MFMVLTLSLAARGAQAPQAAPAAPAAPEATPRPPLAPKWLNQMPQIAAALGVSCEFCHGRPTATSPGGAAKRAIARQMMLMVDDLNEKIPAVTGKPPADAATVQCVTCHRGVTIPRPLSEILLRTTVRDGVSEAVAQYRDLRARYYGRGGYDFGEDELLAAGQRLSRPRPDDAIALLELSIEFFPRSTRGYVAVAQAYIQKFDDASAIVYLEKALEIEPDDGIIQGQLYQLRSVRRNR
jgi:tetratricopeptide (TPR) repeat protein